MKIITYNTYCVVNTQKEIPNFKIRLKNMERYLHEIIKNENPDVMCFQEVTEDNIDIVTDVLTQYGYTHSTLYWLKNPNEGLKNAALPIFYKENKVTCIYSECIGHVSKYTEDLEKQELLDGISDFRATNINVFENLISGETYIIANTHTDYISPKAKYKGIIKSIAELEILLEKYKTATPLLLGDMNMVPHMAEVYKILQNAASWTTINKTIGICDNSYHGYGVNEPVNVDFGFVRKKDTSLFTHKVLKKENMKDEPSDHRPVVFTIKNDKIEREK